MEPSAASQLIMSSQHSGVSDGVTSSLSKQYTSRQDQIKRLEVENKVLRSRICGYKTLGDLLHESKDEIKKLAQENEKLKSLLENAARETGASATDLPNCQTVTHASTTESEADKLTQTEQQLVHDVTGVLKSATTDIDLHTPTNDQQVEDNSPSIKARSITKDNVELEGNNSIQEVSPSQGSLPCALNDLSCKQSDTETTAPVNIKQNLELDSDMYDEPEYEKSSGKLSKPSSSMSIISSGPDNKYAFPSLSSLSAPRESIAHPEIYTSRLAAMGVSENLDSEMSVQMRNLLQLQHTAHSTSAAVDLTSQFLKMSEDISKMEDDVKRYKNLAFTFAQENQKSKRSHAMEVSQLKNSVLELREENQHLIARLKDLEHKRNQLADESLTSQTRLLDWVTVQRPVQGAAQASLPDDIDSLMANIRELRQQNKELKAANQSWNKRWQELSKQWEEKVERMKEEMTKYKEEMEEVKSREKKVMEDCERMVQNAKSHAHQEELGREDTLLKLHQTMNLNRSLQDEIASLRMQCQALTRDKHQLEAELSVRKSSSCCRSDPVTLDAESLEELKTEAEVLRQQLTVFEEDFARERQDRAKAQSDKEDLQMKLEQAVYDKNYVSRQNSVLEQRMKGAESNMSQVLRKNEQLQNRVRDMENQNRVLQQNLASLQLQMQQRPVQQPLEDMRLFQQGPGIQQFNGQQGPGIQQFQGQQALGIQQLYTQQGAQTGQHFQSPGFMSPQIRPNFNPNIINSTYSIILL